MAIENAKKFVEKVQADAALAERMKGMTPEEGLALAKELGLEFTEAELKSALNNRELSPEELDEAAGGKQNSDPTALMLKKAEHCHGDTKGPRHNWVKTGHIEEPHSFLLWDYTKGYDIEKCSLCGEERRRRT